MQLREAVYGTHVLIDPFTINLKQLVSHAQVPLCTDSSPVTQLQVQGTALPGWDWLVPI